MDLQGFSHLFTENFDQLSELGASVCIRSRGEEVVHLAGGYRDREGCGSGSQACCTPWWCR